MNISAPDRTARMIWFFERPGERLQCEIRQSGESEGFELVWTTNDGRTLTERSLDPEELMSRRRFLEERLRLDGWVRPGRTTPLLIPLVPRILD
jgi:hypothetical protein